MLSKLHFLLQSAGSSVLHKSANTTKVTGLFLHNYYGALSTAVKLPVLSLLMPSSHQLLIREGQRWSATLKCVRKFALYTISLGDRGYMSHFMGLVVTVEHTIKQRFSNI